MQQQQETQIQTAPKPKRKAAPIRPREDISSKFSDLEAHIDKKTKLIRFMTRKQCRCGYNAEGKLKT